MKRGTELFPVPGEPSHDSLIEHYYFTHCKPLCLLMGVIPAWDESPPSSPVSLVARCRVLCSRGPRCSLPQLPTITPSVRALSKLMV